jgi:hypothetical protein
MRTTSTDELGDFVARYRNATFPNSEALFRGIEKDSFSKFLRYPQTQPCHEIAQVYRDRVIMADEASNYANEELIVEFSQIADALGESPDEPCRLWTFRGESGSFSVFEMEHSQRIGGCLFREANNDNDSHETKPA